MQQSDSRYTLVDLGRVEARLPKSEQVPTERYEHGMRLKAVIKEVSQNPKEPPIILSRRSEELVEATLRTGGARDLRRTGGDRGSGA